MDHRLSQVLDDTMARLARATVDRRAAWRLPVLATVSAGRGPQARIVVLRKIERAPLRLVVYTDDRSAKADEIVTDDRVSLLFWDKSASLQLRIDGRASIAHEGPDVEAARARLTGYEGIDYARKAAPGTPLAEPAGGEQRLADALAHFALVQVSAQRLDWLSLARDGHERAVFALDGEAWSGAWVGP